jgi:uncharacterized protein with HEPN domain
MLSDKVRSTLIDIRHNALAARSFIGDMSFDVFKDDLKTFYAVVRALEIVSEASRRLPEDLKNRYPDVPWRSVRDAGNFYRHSYENVATSFIWETALDHLPPLMAVVEMVLAADDGEGRSQTESSKS